MSNNPDKKDGKPVDSAEMLRRLERLERETDAGKKEAAARKAPEQDNDSAHIGLGDIKEGVQGMKKVNRAFNIASGIVEPLKKVWNNYAKPAWEIAAYAWNDYVRPAGRFVAPIAKPLWNGYKWAFNRAAFTKDDNGERTILSKPRALGAIALTGVALLGAYQYAIPFTANLAYDAAMLATHRTESVYLTGANPYDDADENFYVKGCEELPCSDQNSVYYRVRSNTLLSAYRFATTGRAFYPEDVGSAIPEQISQCEIGVYGVRVRSMGFYPYITSVECAPVPALGK